MYLTNYLIILITLIITLVIAVAVFLLSAVLYYQNLSEEKNSTYECGFTPFGHSRSKFDIKFYLVSILFIVFDLEIAFLLPALLSISKFDFLGVFFVLLFCLLVVLGLFYEFKTGSIDW